MDTILQFDNILFEWINQGLQNDFLDWLMPWWRSKYTWIPFYLGLIIFSIWKYKNKGLYFIIALALTVGISDTLSSKVVKKTVKRLRPCKEIALKDTAHVLIRCGSGYSFTSSHATNHFAVAVFLLFTFCRRFKFLKLPLILWATSISLGQVYVGVHYPLDIIFGALLGTFVAYLGVRSYQSFKEWRIIELYEPSSINKV